MTDSVLGLRPIWLAREVASIDQTNSSNLRFECAGSSIIYAEMQISDVSKEPG